MVSPVRVRVPPLPFLAVFRLEKPLHTPPGRPFDTRCAVECMEVAVNSAVSFYVAPGLELRPEVVLEIAVARTLVDLVAGEEGWGSRGRVAGHSPPACRIEGLRLQRGLGIASRSRRSKKVAPCGSRWHHALR
jgi:hypothetical protein